MSEPALVLSCEHGGYRIPSRWAPLFTSTRARRLLHSHRGWDSGALDLARRLAHELRAPLVACTTSRLLADANRPPGHPHLFSAFTRDLPEDEKRAVLRAAHQPHWRAVERAVRRAIARRGRVLHLSVHSFTPVLRGVPRRCNAGLLYDPARIRERVLCARWHTALSVAAPELRVRLNFPYRGTSAALTTSLRRMMPARSYLGIELEISQGLWMRQSPRERKRLGSQIAAALRESAFP
jgi:predicted N-formylglutamate amidohydrolase